MPRIPLVFEKKTRWALDELDGESENFRSIYLSSKGYEEDIERLFREEEALGWMAELPIGGVQGPVVCREFGGGFGEGQNPIVHDGSHGVQVNQRIRTRDQIRMPGAGELRVLLAEFKAEGRKVFGALGDASKAHRRIKIRPEDWGVSSLPA